MVDGASDIQQAVVLMGKSLDLAEEASVHTDEMLATTGAAFVCYRRAFGDDKENPIGVEVCGKAEAARRNADSALAALVAARAAIRDFVRSIAPALELTDSSKARSSPTGEELLDTTGRPRSLKSLGNRSTSIAQDVGDLVDKSIEGFHKFTFSPPTPPEVSGAATRIPQMHSSHEVPPGVTSADVISTAVVSVALAAKAATVVADRISIRIRQFLDRNKT